MSTTTRITAVAAAAALTVPAAALAHGPGKGDRPGDGPSAAKQGKRHGHAAGPRGKHRRAVVVRGVDVASLPVSDGELTGAITLDPTAANRHARRLLELTREELRGEDTVAVGAANDDVVVRYKGLSAGDALQPTDVVRIVGRVTREGKLDVRRITVKRD